MQKIKPIPLITMVIMVILSFSNLFGLKIAGISVIIGVIFFFVYKACEKQTDIDRSNCMACVLLKAIKQSHSNHAYDNYFFSIISFWPYCRGKHYDSGI